MGKIISTEVNERRHRILVDRHELTRAVKALALNALGIADSESVKVEVKFSDATEGSPSYKVGTECVVEITEDLSPAKTEEQAQAARNAFIVNDQPRIDLASVVSPANG